MDMFNNLQTFPKNIKCIDMHTSGGPVRIPLHPLPNLTGPLLSQKSQASQPEHDILRKRILLEPRGHDGMYGVLLRPVTELVESGEADIGVLFMDSGGYFMMCGHVTIAVSRFLVDTWDLDVFPNRGNLKVDEEKGVVELRIHAPCGVLRVTVPVLKGGRKSDPERDISFLSVPAFATGLDLEVDIPDELRWTELGERSSLVVDIAFCGQFWAIVTAQQLGFKGGFPDVKDLNELWKIANVVKHTICTNPELIAYTRLSNSSEPFLIGAVIVRDEMTGPLQEDVTGAESGLVFAEIAIDRSPCGSGTAARVALAYAKGERKMGERRAYHCLLSATSNQGPFVGSPEEEVDIPGLSRNGVGMKGLVVRTEGRAYYTGASTFVLEDIDKMSSEGFKVMELPALLAKKV